MIHWRILMIDEIENPYYLFINSDNGNHEFDR